MICSENSQEWEEVMIGYRINHSTECIDLQINISTPDNLSLKDQFLLLSSLPNHHKWPWIPEVKKLEVKFCQRFSSSCFRYPASPRNRVLQVSKYIIFL